MRHMWRWFGPIDKVTISDARQAGAEGIVTALHHMPDGVVWTSEEIERRKREAGLTATGEPSGLSWEVVESLPISEDIKMQTGNWRAHIDAYRASLSNLAAAWLETICVGASGMAGPPCVLTWLISLRSRSIFWNAKLRRMSSPRPLSPRLLVDCFRQVVPG